MKALIIFARTPIAGTVKTRLKPHLSAARILNIYKSFVRKTLSTCLRVRGADKFMGCTPTKDDNFFHRLVRTHNIKCFNQKGKGLKDRIINAFEDCFKDGYKEIVLVGSDSPTIPLEYLKKAFSELRRHDIVVGPCCDSGLYLIGVKGRKALGILRNIQLETGKDVSILLKKVNASHVNFFMLPFWYDVDTMEDLNFLDNHVKYLKKKR
jgi:rSAM/selenodomain-associated transferase 1